MRMQSLVMAGLGAAGIVLAAASAQAAPAGGLIAAVERDAQRASPVETVTWYGRRHCYWHYGEYHCDYGHRYRRWHRYRHHDYYGYGDHYRPYYGHGYRRGWY